MTLVNKIRRAVSSSCLCPSKSQSWLSVSPQTSPFLTCISDRFQVMKRSNKNGHPGHNDTVSNSYVVLCHIFQGSIHLLSVLNNISSIPLGEESVSLLSFHLHVAQQATTPSAASIYHKETVYLSASLSIHLKVHLPLSLSAARDLFCASESRKTANAGSW